MKKLVRLTEKDLHHLIKESVKKTINEIGDTPKGQYALGKLAGRYKNNPQRNHEIGDYANDAMYNSDQNFDTMDRAYDQGRNNRAFYPQEGDAEQTYNKAKESMQEQLHNDTQLAARLIGDNAEVLANLGDDDYLTVSNFLNLCAIKYALNTMMATNGNDNAQDFYNKLQQDDADDYDELIDNIDIDALDA